MKRLIVTFLLLFSTMAIADQNMAKSTGLTPIEEIESLEQVRDYLVELRETVDKLHRQVYGDINQINRDEIPALQDSIENVDAKIDFDIPLVRNLNFTWNAGTSQIDWDSGTLAFKGSEYTISSGSSSTNAIAVYVDVSGALSSPITLGSTASPAIADDRWYLAARLSTTVYEVAQSPIIHGGLIQANTVQATQIDVDDLFAQDITFTDSIHTALKTTYNDTDEGIWMGLDSGNTHLNIGDATNYIKWNGSTNAVEIAGSVTVVGTAGDKTTAFVQHETDDGIPTSLHVGDQWFNLEDTTMYVAESIGADQITTGEWVTLKGANGGGVVWQGTYSGATPYDPNDIVESGGVVYMCIASTTGNAPPNATYWELFADKGDTGSGFVWLGAYNGGTAYEPNDVIESGGIAYVCIADTTGNIPPNATYWELFADKGVDGFSVFWQGAYSGATAYEPNDIVESNGSSYICILNTTGNAPPNATYWELLADKGDTGATGATGPTGPAGDDGHQVFWQDDLPTASNVGDIWVKTDNSNKIYRWSGSTWSLQNGVFARYIGAETLFASDLTVQDDLIISTGGNIHSGQTAYNTGTGYWLEYNSGTPRFSIGNPAGDYLRWTGSALESSGITGSSYTLTGSDITCDTLTAKSSVQVGEDDSTNSFNIISSGGVTKAKSRYNSGADYYQTNFARGGIQSYYHSSFTGIENDSYRTARIGNNGVASYFSRVVAGKTYCSTDTLSDYDFYAGYAGGRFGNDSSTEITYNGSGVVDVPAAAVSDTEDLISSTWVQGGTYAGDGNATKAITHGLGRTPVFIIVGAYSNNSRNTQSWTTNGGSTKITSVGSTTFTVNDNAGFDGMNTSGVSYYFTCF